MRPRAEKAAQSTSRSRLVDNVTVDSGAVVKCLAPALASDQAFVMQPIQNFGRGGVDKPCRLADLAVDVPCRRSAKLPELRENRVLQIAARKTKPLHHSQRTTPVVDGQSVAMR